MEKVLTLLFCLGMILPLCAQTNVVLLRLVSADQESDLAVDDEPQYVFSGGARKIKVPWSIAGHGGTNLEIRAQVIQCSSATALRLGESAPESLERSQQLCHLVAKVDFPAVRGETWFVVRWMNLNGKILGRSEVLAYPTNLLSELRPLLEHRCIGVLDPNNALKPSFEGNGVHFLDLSESALEDFQGRLVVVGPFNDRRQMRPGLDKAVRRIARRGSSVVWLLPPRHPQSEIKPSFYVVPEGRGTVVLVQPELITNFAGNPRAQLDFVHFCKLALNPEPFSIPNLADQP